jgi:hypothetical protein
VTRLGITGSWSAPVGKDEGYTGGGKKPSSERLGGGGGVLGFGGVP